MSLHAYGFKPVNQDGIISYFSLLINKSFSSSDYIVSNVGDVLGKDAQGSGQG
jgi:hypothetical protein